jgi:hypothetical protein
MAKTRVYRGVRIGGEKNKIPVVKSAHVSVKIHPRLGRCIAAVKPSRSVGGLFRRTLSGDLANILIRGRTLQMVRNTPIESIKTEPQPAPPPKAVTMEPNVELWVNEQMFEEDVRAVLKMMRPNSRERLQGWNEYRTGGAHFRVTVSWDDEFQITSPDTNLAVPHMTEVIETLIVGSARNQDEMNVNQEFEQYRQVVREVYQRIEQRQACYE